MEILDQAVAKLGSVSAVARYLKVTSPYLFQVRSGRCPLAPFHEGRLAELMEQNPAQAYVAAQIRAAGKKEEAVILKRWFRKVAASIAAVFVVAGLSGSWTPAKASSDAFTPEEKKGESRDAIFNASDERSSERQGAGRLFGWLRKLWLQVIRGAPEQYANGEQLLAV